MTANTMLCTGNQPSDLSSHWLAITEHALLPMATVEGTSHVVRHVNPAFCRLIDGEKEQLVGKEFSELLPEKDIYVTLLDRVFRTGNPENHTEQEYSNSHPIFWSCSMWPIMANDRPVGVVIQVTETAQFHEKTLAMNEALILGSVRQHELTATAYHLNTQLHEEITERKKMGDELRKVHAQLADHAGQLEQSVTERTMELTAANKQLEAMVYSIAHDLRAPLRSMQGFSVLLIRESDLIGGEGRGYADRINKSAQFMDAMVKDILAFSRICQQRIESASVSLKIVVDLVLADLKENIRESNGRIESPGPWPVVLAHQPILVGLLSHLVSNALKFAGPEVPPLVLLRTEDRAEFIRVWVEDNGCGIAPDYQDQIFRLFTRLEGDKHPGTGVGLAIVQKGIERMGGRVGVDSAPGHGSQFWLELRKPSKN